MPIPQDDDQATKKRLRDLDEALGGVMNGFTSHRGYGDLKATEHTVDAQLAATDANASTKTADLGASMHVAAPKLSFPTL